jgi:hypothetical protein
MKSTLKTLIAISALTLTASAFADIMPAVAKQGLYVGADLGSGSTYCDNCAINTTGNASTSNNGFAAVLFGGYQLNSKWALETGMGMLPEVEYTKTNANNSFQGSSDVTTSYYYWAVKRMVMLNNEWSVFGKLGYSVILANSTGMEGLSIPAVNATGTLLAVGASYIINTQIDATASYNYLSDSGSENVTVGYAAVGLTYLF